MLKIWRVEISLFPMDRRQLVTIAITAVTSVIAKELISWLVALARSTAQMQTAKKKASTVFSRSNLRTLYAIMFLLLTGFLLWARLHETTPVTRSAVAWIVVSMANLGVAILFLGYNILSRIDDWLDRRSKKVHPSVPVNGPGYKADYQPTPDTEGASRRLP